METERYSTEVLMDRWEDQREIKNLMGKYVTSILLKREKSIFTDFWSKAKDVCLGVNDGYYIGAASVKNYYGECARINMVKAKLLQRVFPDALSDLSDEELYGVGVMEIKPLTSPIIIIAEDGKTAKGIWYIYGTTMDVTPAGPCNYWELGPIAADFKRENNEWKIWHVLDLKDINHIAGQNLTLPNNEFPDEKEFAELREVKMPVPDVSVTLRELYSGERQHTPMPRLPESYRTFTETFSYGYEEGDNE